MLIPSASRSLLLYRSCWFNLLLAPSYAQGVPTAQGHCRVLGEEVLHCHVPWGEGCHGKGSVCFNFSQSKQQRQLLPGTIRLCHPGSPCAVGTGGGTQERNQGTLAEVRVLLCTPQHKLCPGRTGPRPALPTQHKHKAPTLSHPVLVSLRSTATGWKSEGRKDPEVQGS